jgi:hypothetical protein
MLKIQGIESATIGAEIIAIFAACLNIHAYNRILDLLPNIVICFA